MNPAILPESTLSRLQSVFANIRGVNGQVIPVLGRVDVCLQFDQLQVHHPVYVANIAGEIIIGMDFLTTVGCTINLQEGYLKICDVTIKIPSCSSVPSQSTDLLPSFPVAVPVHVTAIVPDGRLPEPLAEMYARSAEGLDVRQRTQLEELIRQHLSVFSQGNDDIGRTSVVKHLIDTQGSKPIKIPPRRLPIYRREEAHKLLEEMRAAKVISPSTSPWSSPVVLVKKKNGSLRFCVDYRRLNDATKKDSYPLPRIDLTIEALGESQWFSTLDLQSGYWQVEMAPEDKEKTAFTFGHGLYEFNVMPFGLANAPATFQRLMELVLNGVPPQACLVYLDDIIVHGRSFEEAASNLQTVLNRLSEAGLKLSPSKCHLFREEVKYLGFIISRDGLKTDPEKVSAVTNWPTPKNKKELQSFLGLCAYYRRFVKNFSVIAGPLNALTRKNIRFEWTSETQESFERLKTEMATAPVLRQPREDAEFLLDTDASHHAWGAVLAQIVDGREHVVEYYSKTFSRPELNYCVTRKELLAVIKSVQHFQPYLLGRHFTVRTDHASLKWLMNFKNPEGQTARWIEILQQFDFDVQHRAGNKHANADALSRRPCEDSGCSNCTRVEARDVVNVNVSVVLEDIGSLQQQDEEIGLVQRWLQEGHRPPSDGIRHLSPNLKALWSMWPSLVLRNGIVFRKFTTADGTAEQIILPRALRCKVLEHLHENPAGGHFGYEKTLAKVKSRYYWIGCSDDTRDWCTTCEVCQSRGGGRRKQKAALQIVNAGAPFERVAIDVLGPLPTTNRGNRYVLVLMDYFTKWPEALALPDQTAETVADALLDNVFSRFGVPLELHSDQGRNFESDVFQQMLKRLQIEKTRTTPRHPQSDGMVERFNRTIANYLAKYVSDNQKDWDEYLPMLLLAYRSALHETTQQTPAKLLFGRELRLPIDLVLGSSPEEPTNSTKYVQKLQDRLHEIHNQTRTQLSHKSRRMKERYDLRSTAKPFSPEDEVWFFWPRRTKGKCPKLQRDWEGPYVVKEKLGEVLYKIAKPRSHVTRVVHRNYLAPYLRRGTT